MSKLADGIEAFLNERDEHECDNCGGYNPAWACDHLTWFEGTGVPEGEGGGILCPSCFTTQWQERQGRTVLWDLTPSDQSAEMPSLMARIATALDAGWKPTAASLRHTLR